MFMDKKIIVIEGMSCEHCANRVKNSLEQIDGVDSCSVDLVNNQATLSLKKEVSSKVISDVIDDLGYKVVEIKNN